MKSLITIAGFLFLVVFVAYVAVEAVPSDLIGGPDRVRIISEKIEVVGHEAWMFGRPILQLAVMLVIVEWALARAGIKLDPATFRLSWDVRSFVAILVVASFCLAALAGSQASGALEDVCLVVIGFYFGGLTKGPAERSSDSTEGAAQPSP
jgi:hypothetical protein